MATDTVTNPLPEIAETPAQRFVRLANPRVNRVLHAVRIVGNLSGQGYEYTPEQATEVLAAMRAAVDEVEKRLFKEKPEPKQFSLSATN